MSQISKEGCQNGSDQIKRDDLTPLTMIPDRVKKLSETKITFLQQHTFANLSVNNNNKNDHNSDKNDRRIISNLFSHCYINTKG